MEDMGYGVEASHHEMAPAQHEIDLEYTEAMDAADNIMTFKIVTKQSQKTWASCYSYAKAKGWYPWLRNASEYVSVKRRKECFCR